MMSEEVDTLLLRSKHRHVYRYRVRLFMIGLSCLGLLGLGFLIVMRAVPHVIPVVDFSWLSGKYAMLALIALTVLCLVILWRVCQGIQLPPVSKDPVFAAPSADLGKTVKPIVKVACYFSSNSQDVGHNVVFHECASDKNCYEIYVFPSDIERHACYWPDCYVLIAENENDIGIMKNLFKKGGDGGNSETHHPIILDEEQSKQFKKSLSDKTGYKKCIDVLIGYEYNGGPQKTASDNDPCGADPPCLDQRYIQ